MDFLRITDNIQKFESLLLRNSMKLDVVLEKLEFLESKMKSLGTCTQEAFNQTKTVVNELCQRQKDLGETLDSYGGVLESSTWMCD